MYFSPKKVRTTSSRQLSCPKGGSTNIQLTVHLKCGAYLKKACKRLSAKAAGYFADIC